jgi:hypothetical protein
MNRLVRRESPVIVWILGVSPRAGSGRCRSGRVMIASFFLFGAMMVLVEVFSWNP